MNYIWITLIIIGLLIGALWIIIFIFLNDFSLPTQSIYEYKSILVIFPHSDDEVLTVGGLLKSASDKGIKTSLMVLTHGERGTKDGSLAPSLKSIRKVEIGKVSELLHIKNLILRDLGDGELDQKKKEVQDEIKKTIGQIHPDLIITYDQTGLYGHADHIVVSEIVTDLISKNYPGIKLWYVEYPKRVMQMIILPERMAKDPDFKRHRKLPTNKIFIGASIVQKIQSVRAYQSQYHSFRSAIPIPLIPMEFFHSTMLFEYFYEVN